MRIAYLDCFSGISGDMFLGALLDAGVPAKLVEDTVAELNIGAHIKISRVIRSGISAAKVDVHAPGKVLRKHHQKHGHQHAEDPSHAQEHEPAKASGLHEHGRGLNEIREIIGQTRIDPKAKSCALSIFESLGAAEAKIHDVPAEKIHFHEVGAVDAIVDIVCAAVGTESLGVDEIVCSPLNLGGGTVECAHGTFPVPAPATVELLKGAPVFSSGIQAELVTPTGAAIVKTLVARFGPLPEMKIEKTGYGAGSADFPRHANVLRLTVGEAATGTSKTAEETISILEANLDDLNPQVFGYVLDRLLAAGALDVFGIPVQMKKSRPGTLLTALCKPDDAGKLAEIIFAETTTLGVRRREEKRQILSRQWIAVPTQWGEVRMKIASMNGTVTNYSPEYEDCRRIAADHKVPLKNVMEQAVQRYLSKL